LAASPTSRGLTFSSLAILKAMAQGSLPFTIDDFIFVSSSFSKDIPPFSSYIHLITFSTF
jgi:hypothetical protein